MLPLTNGRRQAFGGGESEDSVRGGGGSGGEYDEDVDEDGLMELCSVASAVVGIAAVVGARCE